MSTGLVLTNMRRYHEVHERESVDVNVNTPPPSPPSPSLSPSPSPDTMTMSRARRNLFGPVDHEENKTFLQRELERISRQDSQRWNFNFATETPLSGRYQWVPVNGNNVVEELDSISISATAAVAAAPHIHDGLTQRCVRVCGEETSASGKRGTGVADLHGSTGSSSDSSRSASSSSSSSSSSSASATTTISTNSTVTTKQTLIHDFMKQRKRSHSDGVKVSNTSSKKARNQTS